MKKNGFSLVEMVIAIVICSVIIGLTFPAFKNLLTASKSETASEEVHIDKIISLELIRLDLENSQYGIAQNEPTVPMTWDDTNKIFQINSTLNNTNSSTIGWLLYDCTSGGTLASNLPTDKRQETSNNNIVLLDSDKNFESLTTTGGSCPTSNGIYTAFPYDAGGSNACTTQWCTSVKYQLSSTNDLSTCAAGTKNLLRVAGTGTGIPVVNCVADFQVTFDLDTDGNDIIDVAQTTTLPTTTGDILSQVKNIDMYILMQVGQRDDNLNSNVNMALGGASALTLSAASVTEDASKFRWKVVRISGKPMSW
jgi:type IV pilus assembly protein PilW